MPSRHPGFVDAHSHDDLALLDDPGRAVKTRQGIVHQVIGNCGVTPWPLLEGAWPEYESFVASVLGSATVFESFDRYRSGLASNVTCLAGYNSLRARLFGRLARSLRAGEREKIGRAIRETLDEGVVGVSIGLSYVPALFADREELVSLAMHAPLVCVHMRNESDRVIGALDEVVGAVSEARRRGGFCRLHISHLKIAGRANWDRLEELVISLRRGHEAIGLTFDHYPFTFGSTGLRALLPPEMSGLSRAELGGVDAVRLGRRLAERDWENYVAFAGPENLELAGLVARPDLNGSRLPPSPARDLLDRLIEEPAPVVMVHAQSDAVIDELMRLPFGCAGTDALPALTAHPRLTSTFPEYLKRARLAGIPIPVAVEKLSELPRRIFGIGPVPTVSFDTQTGSVA